MREELLHYLYQTYDIGFVIDPQIPQNQNWSISGTNATIEMLAEPKVSLEQDVYSQQEEPIMINVFYSCKCWIKWC